VLVTPLADTHKPRMHGHRGVGGYRRVSRQRQHTHAVQLCKEEVLIRVSNPGDGTVHQDICEQLPLLYAGTELLKVPLVSAAAAHPIMACGFPCNDSYVVQGAQAGYSVKLEM
jgi:hypothetical protein